MVELLAQGDDTGARILEIVGRQHSWVGDALQSDREFVSGQFAYAGSAPTGGRRLVNASEEPTSFEMVPGLEGPVGVSRQALEDHGVKFLVRVSIAGMLAWADEPVVRRG